MIFFSPEKTFEGISASELVKMMSNVDMGDPDRAMTAIDVVGTLVMGAVEEEKTITGNEYPTTTTEQPPTTTTAESEANAGGQAPATEEEAQPTTVKEQSLLRKEVDGFLKIIVKFSETKDLQPLIHPYEYRFRMDLAGPMSTILSEKYQYKRHWALLKKDSSFVGAHDYRKMTEDYLMALSHRRNLTFERRGSITSFRSTKCFGVQVDKYTPNAFRLKGAHHPENYWKFPTWRASTWNTLRKDLGASVDPIDSVDSKTF